MWTTCPSLILNSTLYGIKRATLSIALFMWLHASPMLLREVVSIGCRLLCHRQESGILWWPCLSVCLSASIPPELHVRSFVHATYVRGSVLLWRRLRYVMYFRLYRWRHVCIYIYWPGLGDAILTQQGMAWIYQRGVYSRWLARGNTGWGAESDIYDCLVLRSSGW